MTTTAKEDCPLNYKISYKSEESNLFVFLAGEFGLKNLTVFRKDIRRQLSSQSWQSMTIDFTEVCYLDSAAALAFVQIEKWATAENIQCRLINLNDESKGIFNVITNVALIHPPSKSEKSPDGSPYPLVERRKSTSESENFPSRLINKLTERRGRPSPSAIPYANAIRQVGQSAVNMAIEIKKFITFIGELLVALFYTLRHPKTLRGQDVIFYVQRAGVDGLPIVAMIGALMGLIMAFMSYLQFKQFGANIYVPALVSFAMVKELGPIMTAILVAGRSGSAFAAEIGTMVVNEEVDALHTMGFDPIRFLAIPKVLAAVIVVPVLTVYADLAGIIGGMIIGITTLDLTVKTYITQSIKTIQVFDVVTSLIKAGVFAGLISAIGCQRGFQVRAGAQDVGKFTTSAVVTAIFMIVVADSIFAVMLYYIKN